LTRIDQAVMEAGAPLAFRGGYLRPADKHSLAVLFAAAA